MSPARFVLVDSSGAIDRLMNNYRFTVAMKHGSAYVIAECPSCDVISAYEVVAIGIAESLPCPCGHSVEVTSSLYERMLEKVRETLRTVPTTQTSH